MKIPLLPNKVGKRSGTMTMVMTEDKKTYNYEPMYLIRNKPFRIVTTY